MGASLLAVAKYILVKYMKKNLDIAKTCYSEQIILCQSLGPSLYRGSTAQKCQQIKQQKRGIHGK